MSAMVLLLGAAALQLCSGLPACFMSARSRAGQRVSTVMLAAGSLAGFAGLVLAAADGMRAAARWPWSLPWGQLALGLDPLSAWFLGIVFVVPVLGAFYGNGYWRQDEHVGNGRRLGLMYGVLAGAMTLVLLARDGIVFLIAWELMALAAFFAATTEDERREVRRAGWVYLVATHVGTLCLLAMFILWRQATGTFELAPAPHVLPASTLPVFVLAVVGFGVKAGIMPLHVWLPGAHANAPSHVSAVLSGVMLKMGVYGMFRMTGLLPVASPWWGGGLLAIGAVTALAGIAFALGQRDLKRLLAYSSIENIGIIVLGLGLALVGRAVGRPDWIVLGAAGALLHTLNHALFKPLLFFCAGAVIHATGTRTMDHVGGLAGAMPRTAILSALGALAISGLPPLNGFAGEWLLYLGFLGTLETDGAVLAMGAVVLAAVGALALACFVRFFAGVFLGAPRQALDRPVHEPDRWMQGPMWVLAAACVVIGFVPATAVEPLLRVVQSWSALPAAGVSAQLPVPLGWFTWVGVALSTLVPISIAAGRRLPRAAAIRRALTWDCGYAAPTARMQYTGSSFTQTLQGLMAPFLRPRRTAARVRGPFPAPVRFRTGLPDLVLDRIVLPCFRLADRYLPRFRILQQGHTHLYLLYILVIMLVLLAWGRIGGN